MVSSEFKKEKKKKKKVIFVHGLSLKKWLCMWISSYYEKLKSNYRMCYQSVRKKSRKYGWFITLTSNFSSK